MITVVTNQSIEVNKIQYDYIMNDLSTSCFGRQDGNKYYIKLAIPKYKFIIQNYLNK